MFYICDPKKPHWDLLQMDEDIWGYLNLPQFTFGKNAAVLI